MRAERERERERERGEERRNYLAMIIEERVSQINTMAIGERWNFTKHCFVVFVHRSRELWLPEFAWK